MHAELTEDSESRLVSLFPEAERDYVRTILIEECGRDLPGCERQSPAGLDRIRFAVLKLSGGSLDAFDRAVTLAQTDWRDLLVAAGFAESVDAHLSWDPR